MKIFFSVGEPSGDVHGANLIRAFHQLDPQIECVGFGGPRMAAEGLHVIFDLTSLAVMWVWEVLTSLRKFFALADQAETYFQTEKPDAVVLIDYPGFNWHVAKRAKRYGIPVFYYSPPQIWGWKQGRVKKMRQLTDLVFSGLPFEARWLREHGCQVESVGHPFFDEVQKGVKESEIAERLKGWQPLIGILPGSRTGEVKRNFPTFWQTMLKISREQPETHFAIAAFREEHADWIRDFLKAQPEKEAKKTLANLEVLMGRTPEIIQAAQCCLSVSGSVSLELLSGLKPTVICYRVGRFGWWLQWLFRRVRFITLVNLLATAQPFRSFNPEYRPDSADAKEVIFPEYLICCDRSDRIAADLLRWLKDDVCRQECVRRLAALKAEIARPGAAKEAAKRILAFCEADFCEADSERNA